MTLRRAALIAGLSYLLGPVTYAEFHIYPKLVVADNAAQTLANISAQPKLFAIAMMCYVIAFLEDIVTAWALYYLLAPVSRTVSLLAAWMRIVYAGIAIIAAFNLAVAFRLATTPVYATMFGRGLAAQVWLAIHAFRYEWGLSLVVFGIHLVLVGYLIVRSWYVPKVLGVLLALDGLAWIVTELQPYLYPAVNVDALFFVFFAELLFMLWLLVGGWRLKEPQPIAA